MSSINLQNPIPHDAECGNSLLVIDDDELAKDRVSLSLGGESELSDLKIFFAKNIKQALDILSRRTINVALLDKNLGLENGIEAIPELLNAQPHLQIIMLTGSNDLSDVVQATKFGAFDYLTKDVCHDLLVVHVKRAIRVSELTLERIRRERKATVAESTLGGSSQAYLAILSQAKRLAATNRPVLLLGQTGTGKSALAKWINLSRAEYLGQKERPFFAINVSTLSGNLIESELFGHERGAFTGANETKQGLFELANSGTLFLDEIGELPLEFQAKLLTVVEEGIFKRVGGKQMLRAAPKLIFATNRDLEKMVKEGTFRRDLFMRISMFPIRMPSLSERKEDIPEIVRALLPKSCRETGVFVSFEEIPPSFIEFLQVSPIEGNIRGVQNLIERLLVLAPRDRNERPILSMWRQICGFSEAERQVLPTLTDSVRTLSLYDLMERPTHVMGPKFPGIKKVKESIERRILEEARELYPVDKDIAIALGISKSATSALLSRMKHSDEQVYQGESHENEKQSS